MEGRNLLNMTDEEIQAYLRQCVATNRIEEVSRLVRREILSSVPALTLGPRTAFSRALRMVLIEYMKYDQDLNIRTLLRAVDSPDFDRDSLISQRTVALYRQAVCRELAIAISQTCNRRDPGLLFTCILASFLISRMLNLTRVDNETLRCEAYCRTAFEGLCCQVPEEYYRAFRPDPAPKHPERLPHISLKRKRPCSLEALSDEPQPSPYGPRESQPESSRSCEPQPGSSRSLEPQPEPSRACEPQPGSSPSLVPQPEPSRPCEPQLDSSQVLESRPAPSGFSGLQPESGSPHEAQPERTGLPTPRYVDYFSSGSGSDTHPGMKKRTVNPYIGGFGFPEDVEDSRLRDTAEPPERSEALGRGTHLGDGSQPEADGLCESRDAVGLSQQPDASRGKENDSGKQRREEQDSDLSD